MSYHPRIHNASNDRELTTSPFTCRVAGGSGATTTTTIPVSETSLPVACKPVQIHPNGQEEKEPNNSIHRRETVTIEEASHPPPPPPPRSTRPAKRTSSTLSFSSSDSSTDEDAVGAKLLMSGAKQPSPHHTARMLEELFSSESSDSGEPCSGISIIVKSLYSSPLNMLECVFSILYFKGSYFSLSMDTCERSSVHNAKCRNPKRHYYYTNLSIVKGQRPRFCCNSQRGN